MEMYVYGPRMGGWGWAFGLGSLVFWVLVAVAIIAVILYFTRSGRRPFPPYQGSAPGPYARPGPPPGPPVSANPEQVLAERFARGEIDEEEFRQRLSVLRAEAPRPGPGPTPP